MISTALFVSALLAATSLVCAAPAVTSLEARSHQPQVYLPDIMIQIKEAWPDHPYGDTSWGLVSRVSVLILHFSVLILMYDLVAI